MHALRDWEAGGGGRWTSEEAARRWAAIRPDLASPRGLAAIADRIGPLLDELAALEASTPDVAGLRALAAEVRGSSAADWLGRLGAWKGGPRPWRPGWTSGRSTRRIGTSSRSGATSPRGRLDGASYDLLASESCLTSFLTIARGEAPGAHWFQLGRPFIRAAGRIGLISWGGTMFEYLMPRLLLRGLPGTLVAEACRTAVARQVEYGRRTGVPWGISESAFNAQYADGDYQYQAFGVPGLGLKRGLDRDLVVAPYATALAAMIAPREALQNFRRLAEEGGEGAFGFYEAIDYTPDRVPQGRRSVVVRSYMAHHQGMSLVALANAVLDDPMPRRFHAEPMVRAVELLLQERVPRDVPIVEPSERRPGPRADRQAGRVPAVEPAVDHAGHALAAHPPAVQRAVSRPADQRRVGLEHLPRPGRDPLARGRHARRSGASPVTSATSGAARPGPPATSRSAGRPTTSRSSSRPTRRPSGAATRTSRPCWRWPSRRSTSPRSAASR